VGATHRTEKRDQRGEYRNRRRRVGKERHSHISAAQALAHDAGADDRRGQQ
jgi:hypothetical protein